MNDNRALEKSAPAAVAGRLGSLCTLAIADFFPCTEQYGSTSTPLLQAAPVLPGTASSGCLLCGPRGSGKTALLLQYAITRARRGGTVLCFLSRGSSKSFISTAHPLFTTHDINALERVKLKYVDNVDDLLHFASCCHLGPVDLTGVSAILVDGLSDMVPDTSPVTTTELAQTLAYLTNTAHQAQPNASEAPCTLVVTDTSSTDGLRNLSMYRRWLPLVLSIQTDGSNFTLGLHASGRNYCAFNGHERMHMKITYQLQESNGLPCKIRHHMY